MSEPKPIVFFIDRCLGGKTVPQALQSLGVSVEFHDNHFDKEAQDIEWLPKVAEKGWIVLTKDVQIGKRSLEKQAVARAGIKMFVLASKDLSGSDMAEAFKLAITAMQEFVRKNQAPFIAKVYRDGRVMAWKDREDLLTDIESSSDS